MTPARALASAGALLAATLLVACSSTGAATAPRDASPQEPGATSTGPERAADGPVLRVGAETFDPVADDEDPEAGCAGRPGREALTTFDRAAWPDLGLAAGETVLTCGNASGAGWRHIADGHTEDFGELASLVDASWEDVALWAIDHALESPTRVEEYRDDIVNYDVLVEYVDGTSERSWMVTVGVGLGSGQIITSFPDEQR